MKTEAPRMTLEKSQHSAANIQRLKLLSEAVELFHNANFLQHNRALNFRECRHHECKVLQEMESLVQSHLDTPPSPRMTRDASVLAADLNVKASFAQMLAMAHCGDLSTSEQMVFGAHVESLVRSGDTPGVRRVPVAEIEELQRYVGTIQGREIIHRWLSRGTP